MAADNGPIERPGYNTKTANFGINFGDKKFSWAAYLLLFCLYKCSRNFVSQNNTLGVELNSRTFVGCQIVDDDEFLPLPQHLPQFDLWPLCAHVFSG